MSRQTPSTDDEDSWKDRYLRSLDGAERREDEARRTEEALRHALVRLTRAAAGVSPALDAELKALRASLWAGEPAQRADTIASRIAAHVGALEDEAEGDGAALATLLADLLIQADLADDLARDAHALRRELTTGSLRADAAQARERVTGLVRRALASRAPAPDPAGGPRGGLLGRLVGQPQGAGPAATLAALVERIDLPATLGSRREDVLARLRSGPEADSSIRQLEEVADLVAAGCAQLAHEHRELERFLFGVSRRLRAIEGHLGEAHAVQQGINDSGLSLERRVRDGMASMRISLAGATDLDEVKTAIVGGLDAVEHHLDDFRARETELARRAEAHIQSLRGQVSALEDEGTLLRERLEEEHRKALRDPLTGVPNRQAFEEHMAQAFARWRRYDTPLALIIMDIDRFKILNDTFGHPAGDKVLRAVADHLRSQTRASDLLARYGGEEFAVILPETHCREALAVAEKLRRRVEAYAFRYKGQPVRVTVSCGVTTFRAGDTPETAVARADAFLYKAKGGGRNRCAGDC